MRVLHVIPSLASADGGPSRALQDMERALSGCGVHVETACTDHAGARQRNGKPCLTPVLENGVTRRYFAKRTEFYKVAPSFVPWMRDHVRGFDVVHVHALFSFMSVAAASAARKAAVPYVIRPLGVLNEYGVNQSRPLLKRLSLRVVESRLLRDAAAVHFTSPDEQAQAQTLGIAMNSVVVPLGIDLTRDTRTWPDRPKPSPDMKKPLRLLFLSRVHPKKNLEALIGALAQVRGRGVDACLCIAGDGEETYLRTLRQLADETGVSESVTWLGHVEGERKASAFADADVFVLPSHSENFGIALVEAIAAGLPCVVSEGVALAAEIAAAGAGVRVQPHATSIADGIVTYADSEEIRHAASLAGRSLAEREYSMASMGQKLTALYQEICREAPQARDAQA
jgi:glycosyltransferase involved in cell wall biosynthesis